MHPEVVGARLYAKHQSQHAASAETTNLHPVRLLRLVFDTAALRRCVIESSNKVGIHRGRAHHNIIFTNWAFAYTFRSCRSSPGNSWP